MASALMSDTVLQYTGIGFAVISLIPQAYFGLKNKSLVDVSATSMGFIGLSACAWGLYMYKLKYYAYATATAFVGLNAVFIILNKIRFYYQRLDEHMKAFDQPSGCPMQMQPQCADSQV